MNVFGGEMRNIGLIFGDYVKELKLTASDSYIYVIRDNVFGDIIFSTNSSGINMINCRDIHDKYFGKMYSVNVIKEKTIGYESDIGVLEGFDNIARYNAMQIFEKAMFILRSISNDILTADNVQYTNSLNANENFYNDILIKKSADGAGKFILNDRAMYLAQTMLPGSKSTDLDAEMYYKTGNDYYTMKFISHKKQYDVYTFMRFLCI